MAEFYDDEFTPLRFPLISQAVGELMNSETELFELDPEGEA